MYSEDFDVKRCEQIAQLLQKKHRCIRKYVIGHTELNRKICAYSVGNADGLLVCAVFHSMERIGGAMSLRFLNDVCEKMREDANFERKVLRSGLTVVPMVNPDGVELCTKGLVSAPYKAEFISECLQKSDTHYSKWQANINGVDINHNFDAGFEKVKENERKMGIVSPAPTRYGGTSPESERETKALCDLCRRNNFSVAVALHSQGREIYYDYGGNTPKESLEVAQKLSELSGYEVSYPEGIAVGGGFKDWFIEKFSRPAFTFEIGKGENPLPPDIFDTEYPAVSKMLFYLLSNCS